MSRRATALLGLTIAVLPLIVAARPHHAGLVFDVRQVEQPPPTAGNIGQFRASDLWRDYRPEMIAALSVVILQALLIGGLLLERRRRRRVERDGRRHFTTAIAHLERRHAMGEVTASIAHELHQPLAAILRNAEVAKTLLTTGSVQPDRLRHLVEDIWKDDQRASEVIRRLRTLLCQPELQTGPLNVKDVVEDVAAIVAPEAAFRRVHIKLELPATPCMVSGDRVHLQQVLLNMMLNGMEAMAPTSSDRRKLVVRAACRNGSVIVSVNDTGPGIPKDTELQIFEPLYTTKGRGMGMGLSIARTIVEAHGGQIEAENSAHGGATVQFSLPLRQDGASVAR